ncbi:MAG: type II secretion system F family protein [Candidatus Nanohaloarchaea archaeon]
MNRFYQKLPDQYTDRVESEASYAKIDNYDSIVLKGFITFFTASIATGFFLMPYSLHLNIGVGLLIGLVTGFGVPLTFISLRAERRKNNIEDVLPDALRLVSSNTRSGHTLEKAFLLSARDEFGPLAEELRLTAMEMYGGTSVEESLEKLELRVKSELFQETLKLLIDGIKAGGDKADLLESSAEDIRNSMEIREEIQSSIRMYVIFIMMVAVAGAPVLFSVSVYMADTTTEMWEGSEMDMEGPGGGMGSQIGFDLSFQAPQVDVGMFENFAYMAIITTNTFAALIISEIRNGNVKNGIKYAPIFATVSVLIFIGVNSGIATALSGIG